MKNLLDNITINKPNDLTYIWSSTYNRIFKTVGDLNIEDDNITILVDKNGDMYDFISLNAENCFGVEVFKNFIYKDYVKNLEIV